MGHLRPEPSGIFLPWLLEMICHSPVWSAGYSVSWKESWGRRLQFLFTFSTLTKADIPSCHCCPSPAPHALSVKGQASPWNASGAHEHLLATTYPRLAWSLLAPCFSLLGLGWSICECHHQIPPSLKGAFAFSFRKCPFPEHPQNISVR